MIKYIITDFIDIKDIKKQIKELEKRIESIEREILFKELDLCIYKETLEISKNMYNTILKEQKVVDIEVFKDTKEL